MIDLESYKRFDLPLTYNINKLETVKLFVF